MDRMIEFAYVGLGGFLGAISRFYLSDYAHKMLGKGFPYGTLLVNSLGSFALGLIMQVMLSREILGDNMRLMVTVGFLGAFTTFSTFSNETFSLFRKGDYHLSLGNIAANLVICLLMVSLGVSLGLFIEKKLF